MSGSSVLHLCLKNLNWEPNDVDFWVPYADLSENVNVLISKLCPYHVERSASTITMFTDQSKIQLIAIPQRSRLRGHIAGIPTSISFYAADFDLDICDMQIISHSAQKIPILSISLKGFLSAANRVALWGGKQLSTSVRVDKYTLRGFEIRGVGITEHPPAKILGPEVSFSAPYIPLEIGKTVY